MSLFERDPWTELLVTDRREDAEEMMTALERDGIRAKLFSFNREGRMELGSTEFLNRGQVMYTAYASDPGMEKFTVQVRQSGLQEARKLLRSRES